MLARASRRAVWKRGGATVLDRSPPTQPMLTGQLDGGSLGAPAAKFPMASWPNGPGADKWAPTARVHQEGSTCRAVPVHRTGPLKRCWSQRATSTRRQEGPEARRSRLRSIDHDPWRSRMAVTPGRPAAPWKSGVVRMTPPTEIRHWSPPEDAARCRLSPTPPVTGSGRCSAGGSWPVGVVGRSPRWRAPWCSPSSWCGPARR